MQDSLFYGKQQKSVHANFSDDDESITKNKKLTSNLSVMWTLKFTEPADPYVRFSHDHSAHLAALRGSNCVSTH